MLARLSETLRLLLLFTRRKEEAKRGRERANGNRRDTEFSRTHQEEKKNDE